VKGQTNKSGNCVVIGGVVEAVRGLLVFIALRALWENQLGFISLNIDIVSFYSTLLFPWFVVYMQLSRYDNNAYLIVVRVLYPAAYLISFFCLVSVLMALKSGGWGFEALIFACSRSCSLILFARFGLNQYVLIRTGRGEWLLLIQLLMLALSMLIYIVLGSVDGVKSVGALGVCLLALDFGAAGSSKFLAHHSLGGEVCLDQYKISFFAAFIKQKTILLYEFLNVVVISLSVLLLMLSTYYASGENREYRVVIAFMSVLWIVSAKSMGLLLSVPGDVKGASVVESFLTVLKYTWYVPLILVLLAYILYFSGLTDQLFFDIVVGVLYYPFMAAVIAFNSVLRMRQENGLLYFVNLALLLFYFAPASILIIFDLISLSNVMHVLGVGYVFRLLAPPLYINYAERKK